MLPSLFKQKIIPTTLCFILASFIVAFFIYVPLSVSAQASLGIEVPGSTGLGTTNLTEIIVKVVRIVLGFLGIIAVIIILYGGYIWMTSVGEEDKINKAKKILINGVIGLIIILSAFAIVSYIISRFQEITTGGGPGGGGGPGIDIGGGALGGGVLENVYPEPGATDVPRNTLIMVSFKEAMAVSTIINENEQSNCPLGFESQGITCGIVATTALEPNIRVINRSDNDTVLSADRVVVMTSNDKDFVFDPVDYLGNPNGYTDYAVNLSDNIDKGNGSPAFLLGGYTWFFEISNILDLMPPHIIAVIPVAGATDVYKNTAVQIDFDEAINIITATGHATTTAAGQLEPDTFDNITVSYDDEGITKYVSGTFLMSNRFKTVTFVTDAVCVDESGNPVINSCGLEPKCLPGDEQITVTVKAAVSETLSGIVDTAGNSLDGNNNGEIEGPPTDNYVWDFSTNNEMDLIPPEIVEPLEPERDAVGVPKNKRVKALFDSVLLSSTLNTDNIGIFKESCNVPNQADFPEDLSCYPHGGFTVYKENVNGAHRVVIRTYNPNLDSLTEYNTRFTSSIKDIYQNCFYPASGP
ncbi:hypothetical protein KKF32_02695 [Patescibacteria group bacterium]|nr:hypothetical protein [Patescibacteria group bacterium]